RDSESDKSRQPAYRNKSEKPSGRFRFEELDIWKMAMDISDTLFDISDELEGGQGHQVAEKLMGFAMEIAGNIADGSASSSDMEFDEALVNARRYIHRAASMMFLLDRRELISESVMDQNLEQLNILSRKMYSLQKSLRGESKHSINQKTDRPVSKFIRR
ncbi:MAG TPA: four helix bundle protein, partial [Desulfatirhabdiaceae bacterium]|nr:four helix bundle protein [Desulfatirhabdiaceae bacterium]